MQEPHPPTAPADAAPAAANSTFVLMLQHPQEQDHELGTAPLVLAASPTAG